MLDVDWTTIRLFLHVLAATVWVGGQLVLAGLVSVLRTTSADAPRMAARRFNAIAWPAYAVLVMTGVWNVIAERDELHGSYATTLWVKLTLVLLSGLTALLHLRARSRARLAAFGALSGLTAVGALFVGIMLAG